MRHLGREVRGWLPADAATVARRRAVSVALLVATCAAIVATGATFLVTEPVVAPVPGAPGVWSSASVYGFPLPYSTSFCCGSGGGPGYSFYFGMNNTYFLHPMSLIADFGIWLAISFGCIYAFTIRRLLLSAASSVVITLATLLLPPLAMVAPTPSSMATLNPMGFPYEYLTYYTFDFMGYFSKGFEFSLGPAIGDFVLWAGIVMAVFGLAILGVRSGRGRWDRWKTWIGGTP